MVDDFIHLIIVLFCRKRRPSESDEEKIDRKTEENIQQVALKNNLTEDAVKKILKVENYCERECNVSLT